MLGATKTNVKPKLDFGDNPPRVIVISAQYYSDVEQALVDGAREQLRQSGADFEIHQVPGVLELAPALRMAINTGKFDAYVVLGGVVDGDIAQETIYAQCVQAITQISTQGFAIGMGVICSDSRKNLLKDANVKRGDAGGDAAAAALHLISLFRKLNGEKKGIGFKPASEHILIAERDQGKKTT
ncbi:hypothetical protein BFP76_04100 [Amylibacter kogurei]|uniref:6,7-dimethyl-8-ribityllumazine synthase n=1 Tax=Paramylibacter kogurei TaxID=1889778 RepID=A0A2G5K5K8_9RHOB|nr:6,7-dimethyl-8-ribityllumazine synthase [Amylibacter kogurei]PIB24399.1 hypothetical protein BFP76_04100 [Amylibacter kogurei]